MTTFRVRTEYGYMGKWTSSGPFFLDLPARFAAVFTDETAARKTAAQALAQNDVPHDEYWLEYAAGQGEVR